MFESSSVSLFLLRGVFFGDLHRTGGETPSWRVRRRFCSVYLCFAEHLLTVCFAYLQLRTQHRLLSGKFNASWRNCSRRGAEIVRVSGNTRWIFPDSFSTKKWLFSSVEATLGSQSLIDFAVRSGPFKTRQGHL